MKGLAWIFALFSVGWASLQSSDKAESWALIVSGDTFGYLSPCGCVKPMTGGIRRRVTAIRDLTVANRTLILDTGGLVKDQSRQSEIKAETLAQAMKLAGVDAVHLSEADRRLGPGMVDAVSRLSGSQLLGDSSTYVNGPFMVAGFSAQAADRNVKQFVRAATSAGRVPVLMLDGVVSAR